MNEHHPPVPHELVAAQRQAVPQLTDEVVNRPP
jgi:hypothetical protein